MTIADAILIAFFFLVFLIILKGIIQTFERNWILSILLLVIFFPLWVCWAFVEIFLPSPRKSVEVIVKKEEEN